MNILQLASAKIGYSSERIFGDSYAYYEVRVSKKYICEKFLDYAYREIIPDCVIDYCLEILTNKITRVKLLKDRRKK